jgi:AsmA protein
MRWFIRLIGVLVLIVAVAVGSVLLLPGTRIAKIAADQIKAQTGRDLVFSGDVSITFWPVIGVVTGPVTLSNADWAGAEPMFSAQSLAIGVNTAGLFGGDVRITRIEAHAPVVRLDQRKDGRANWLLAAPGAAIGGDGASTAGASPRSLTLERLSLTDARLIYMAEGSDTIDLSGVDVTLRWPDPAGGAEITAVVRPAREAVSISATISTFGDWVKGLPQPVNVAISGPGGDISFAGVAGIVGELAGNMTLKTPDTAGFLNALGLGPFDLPRGLGQSADIAAKITLTRDGRLALRDATLDLDGNRLRGAADIQLGGVPQITAQLQAGALDMSALSSAGAGGGATAKGSSDTSGWSKAPIDASGLASFDGSLSLQADSIDLGTLKLGTSQVLMQVERSRAVFQIARMQAYGGEITGEVVANNRSGLSVGGKIDARGVQIQGLLTDAAGLTRMTGTGAANLTFLSSGASGDAIVNALSGDARIEITKGTITGIDLDRLMRMGDGKGGTTVFDSLTATAQISNGVLRNDDLLMLLANFRADGKGRVGLGARDIDYLFTPVALRANAGKGLAIPVRIHGPWSQPAITPDVQAAIELNFAEEKKAFENKAKGEIEKALQEELGITAPEGQSSEDAIQNKIEDELKGKLKKLFD